MSHCRTKGLAVLSLSHDQMDRLYETYPLHFPNIKSGGTMPGTAGPLAGIAYAPLASLAGQVEALSKGKGGAWRDLHKLCKAAHACGIAVRLR